MKVTQAQKIKTGAFVIVCMLILLFLIYLVGRERKIFGGTFTVYADFKNIAGTREGNYVRLAGINIGAVESISMINDTTVRLQLTLDKEIQRHLKSNSIATIGSDGLMGDKLIILRSVLDSNKSVPVKNGDKLKSADPMDMDKIIGNISKIASNAETITDGLSGIVEKINNGKGSLGKLMTDDKLADKLEGTVTTIKSAAGKVNDNMEAAKSSFLLRGYFKRKEKQRLKDSIENAQKINSGEKRKQEN
jgi:phospholipid/cholesterol/gamma-HCH transport system substrate-binding protein